MRESKDVGVYRYGVFDLKVENAPPISLAIEWMKRAVGKLSFQVEDVAVKSFPSSSGNAYTLVFILSASHAVIHSSPEHAWVETVFAFCGKPREDTWVVLKREIDEFFDPTETNTIFFEGASPGGRYVRNGPGEKEVAHPGDRAVET